MTPIRSTSHQHTGIPKTGFNNKKFWDERYSTDIELGSGIGSKGAVLELKRKALHELVEKEKPDNILDVGCGDLELIYDLLAQDYRWY